MRIKAAYDFLGKPGHATRTVLVAGTNGKGTTAGYLTKYLESKSLNVGLYTSPHLIHVSERFYLTGREVTDSEVYALYRNLESKIPSGIWDELSFFEVITLIGLVLFEKAQVDVRVLEVGLGGRWDATNIVEPVVSVITSIGIDHTEFLGDTIEAITGEKAGVMRPNLPTIVGAVSNIARTVLTQHAQQCNANLEFISEEVKAADFLKHNQELAWRAASYIVDIKDKKIVSEKDVLLWGRFQNLKIENGGSRQLLLDVCHNVAGAEAFANVLRTRLGQGTFPGFVSILSDKDVDGILDVLRSILSPIVLFQGKNMRSFNRLRVGQRHRDLYFFEDFSDAFSASVAQWQNHRPWIVCGSVATVGEVIHFFRAEKTTDGVDNSLLGHSPVPLY